MDESGVVLFWLLAWVAFAAVGYAIGNAKGMAGTGLLLGLLLGLIGIVIIAVMPAKQGAPSGTYAALPQPPNSGLGTSLTDSLRELESLKAEGLLTEDEFAQQKRRLLGFGRS